MKLSNSLLVLWLNNAKWITILILPIFLLVRTRLDAFEISNDGRSSIVDQIATYVTSRIDSMIKPLGPTPAMVAREIASPPDVPSTEAALEKIKAMIFLHEKEGVSGISISVSGPASITKANVDLEFSVVVGLAINGNSLRSGIMIFKLMDLRVDPSSKITGIFNLGRVYFSMEDEKPR